MKKINILFTVWGLTYGGAERFVLNVVKNLDKEKYNIVLFCDSQKTGPMEKEFKENGATVVYSRYHRFRHPLKYIKQIKSLLVSEKIDIIHANDDCNMVFPLIAKTKKVKFVAHSHNTVFRFTNNKIVSALLVKAILNLISRNADSRIACSMEAGRAMFGKKSFQVICNGIEVQKFRFSSVKRDRLRKQYKINKKTTVLLNIGRLDRQKNQSFLVDIFEKFQKYNRNSRLIIIGDGVEKERLQERVNALGLREDILILPSRGDVADYYNMADVFVMPSLFEGMPVVSIEAQVNGLRCVFSDSITREADHFGDAVFLSLERSPDYWAKTILGMGLKRNEHGNIDDYDIKNVVEEIDGVYLKLETGK